MKIVLLLNFFAAASFAREVPSFNFNDLNEGRLVDQFQRSARHIGAFSIHAIPNSDAYKSALNALRSEAPSCFEISDIHRTKLPDGTLRLTSATSSQNKGSRHPDCIETKEVELGFGKVSEVIFKQIQALNQGEMPDIVNLDETTGRLETISLEQTLFLDHVHVYKQEKEKANSKYAAPFHIDNGLFLLLTPSPEHPLMVKDFLGKELSTREGEVLVLFGRAMSDWLFQNDKTRKHYRGVPHAVPTLTRDQPPRTVLARMYLAPENAISKQGTNTFKTVFHNLDDSSFPYDHCTKELTSNNNKDGHEFIKSQQDQCQNSDQMFCWMGCLPVDRNCEVENQVCTNQDNQPCCSELDSPSGCLDMDATCSWKCTNTIKNILDVMF